VPVGRREGGTFRPVRIPDGRRRVVAMLYLSLDRLLSPAVPNRAPRGPPDRNGMDTHIRIRGARQHNLKNLDLDLPRESFTVITGPSGSGKSSLALDTIFAEGQRRYVESLSTYAKQFLERMEKPDVDSIEGVSPAVAIEQKNLTKSSRSTVGTATEVLDYLRLLYARVGHTICPRCERRVLPDTVSTAVDRILELPAGTRLMVVFPLPRSERTSRRGAANAGLHTRACRWSHGRSQRGRG